MLGMPRFKALKKDIPLLVVKDILIFPQMVAPFFAGKGQSVKALEVALAEGQEVFLVPPKTKDESPGEGDLYSLGVVAVILQTLKLPDGTVRVLVEGRERAKLVKYQARQDYVRAEVQPLDPPVEIKNEVLSLTQVVLTTLKSYKDLQAKFSKEKLALLWETDKPDNLVDLLVPHLNLSEEKRLEFFLETKPIVRLENLAVTLQVEYELAGLQQEIHKKVKGRLEQNQRNTTSTNNSRKFTRNWVTTMGTLRGPSISNIGWRTSKRPTTSRKRLSKNATVLPDSRRPLPRPVF